MDDGYSGANFNRLADHNVRFIALNSGSANQQENDLAPFLNIINEFYVKDTSKKVKASMKQKGESGQYLATNPPYGYKKGPEHQKRWVVDEEAATCMEGYGPSQIARMLREERIEYPTAYWQR